MSTLLLNSITGLTTSTELTGVNLDLYLREYPNLSKVGIATTATSNYFVMLNETNIELRQPVVSNNLTYNPYSGALNVSGSLSGITTLSMNGAITGITSISISGRLYDGNRSYGGSSQILSSTGSAIQWINASTTNVGSATSIAINLDSTNASKYLTFVDTSSGNNLVKVDTDLTYNPSTNVLTATTFSGSLSGTATTTTNIPNLTGDITSANKVTTISAGIITNSHINASAAIANSKLANSTISGVSLGSTLATLTFGTYLTGTSYNGSTGITIATNATNANTSSTIVARDASGNFNAGIITATFSGNATTATNISNAGTVTLASATESNSIYITQPSYTTDQPVKLLNFDWYGNLWSLGNIRSASTPSNGFGIYSSGTETARFTTSGLTVVGTVTANSDIKLKTNIKTILNALDKVSRLRGVEYDRVDYIKHEIGVIAQEVEEVIPEVVIDNYGTKAVAYSNLVGLLIEAIKEQNQKMDDLTEELNNLKTCVNEIAK